MQIHIGRSLQETSATRKHALKSYIPETRRCTACIRCTVYEYCTSKYAGI